MGSDGRLEAKDKARLLISSTRRGFLSLLKGETTLGLARKQTANPLSPRSFLAALLSARRAQLHSPWYPFVSVLTAQGHAGQTHEHLPD